MAKSGWDAWNSKKAKQAAKLARKVHAGYLVVGAIFLIIGLAAGAFLAHGSISGDLFTLNGEKERSVAIGEELIYVDEGISCISMGKDLSDKVKIETNMTTTDGVTYTADTSADTEYYITYTVTEGRYAGLSRVRTFTVGNGI